MTRTASVGRQSLLAVEGNVAAAVRPAAPDKMFRREIVSAMVASLSRVGFFYSGAIIAGRANSCKPQLAQTPEALRKEAYLLPKTLNT
jgi:hypothetical protein